MLTYACKYIDYLWKVALKLLRVFSSSEVNGVHALLHICLPCAWTTLAKLKTHRDSKRE